MLNLSVTLLLLVLLLLFGQKLQYRSFNIFFIIYFINYNILIGNLSFSRYFLIRKDVFAWVFQNSFQIRVVFEVSAFEISAQRIKKWGILLLLLLLIVIITVIFAKNNVTIAFIIVKGFLWLRKKYRWIIKSACLSNLLPPII